MQGRLSIVQNAKSRLWRLWLRKLKLVASIAVGGYISNEKKVDK